MLPMSVFLLGLSPPPPLPSAPPPFSLCRSPSPPSPPCSPSLLFPPLLFLPPPYPHCLRPSTLMRTPSPPPLHHLLLWLLSPPSPAPSPHTSPCSLPPILLTTELRATPLPPPSSPDSEPPLPLPSSLACRLHPPSPLPHSPPLPPSTRLPPSLPQRPNQSLLGPPSLPREPKDPCLTSPAPRPASTCHRPTPPTSATVPRPSSERPPLLRFPDEHNPVHTHSSSLQSAPAAPAADRRAAPHPDPPLHARPPLPRTAGPNPTKNSTEPTRNTLRAAFGQAQPGRHRRLSASAEHRVEFGVGPDGPDLFAQRQATAILAAHRSASSREGTSRRLNPPMACGYEPSVTAPSVATMLAG